MNTWPPTPEQQPDVETATRGKQAGWRGFLQWLFTAPQGERSAWSIIGWWETRRISYNLIVGGFGFGSLMLFFLFMNFPGMLQPGEDAVEPLALLAAPIGMNFCYTAGWVVELLHKWTSRSETGDTGPILLRLGLGFSLFIVCVPTVLAALACIGRLIGTTQSWRMIFELVLHTHDL